VPITRRGRGTHACAAEFSELYREYPNRPSAAVYKHALSWLELGLIEETLPSRQRADRNRRGFDVAQRARFGRHSRRRRNAILSRRSVREPIVHPKHFRSTLDLVDPFPS